MANISNTLDSFSIPTKYQDKDKYIDNLKKSVIIDINTNLDSALNTVNEFYATHKKS